MPRAKQYENYPQGFFELFRRAIKKPITITCESEAAAKNMRGELYVFRSVLYKNAGKAPLLAANATNLQFSIDDNRLTIGPKKITRDSVIEQALKENDHDSTETSY